MNDPKRQEIKDRIAASQARNVSRGGSASDHDQSGPMDFVKKHPFTTLAGAVAVGILIAGAFPATRGAARKGSAKASAFGAIGAQAALTAFQNFLETAGEASKEGSKRFDGLGETISDTFGDTARTAKREASHIAEVSSEKAGEASKVISQLLARLWR